MNEKISKMLQRLFEGSRRENENFGLTSLSLLYLERRCEGLKKVDETQNSHLGNMIEKSAKDEVNNVPEVCMNLSIISEYHCLGQEALEKKFGVAL